jgi:hypothetical protein
MLIPCEGCNRHVRADDKACPFCGAAITVVPIARPVLDGRLSRAAVFASAVLIAPGCIVQNPPPPNYQQQQQQPPPPPPPDYQQNQNPDFAHPPPDYVQPAAGVVRGSVIDTNGMPQANVRVELHGGTQPFVTVTDGNGLYSIAGVPEGPYTLVLDRGARRQVLAVAGKELIVNLSVAAAPVRTAPPYDRTNIPKPYGAPPARKRIV